jgi:hypothetical protein
MLVQTGKEERRIVEGKHFHEWYIDKIFLYIMVSKELLTASYIFR